MKAKKKKRRVAAAIALLLLAGGAVGLLASLIPKGDNNRIESSTSQRSAKASELVPETNHIYF